MVGFEPPNHLYGHAGAKITKRTNYSHNYGSEN